MLNRIATWIQSLSPVWLGVLALGVLSLFVGSTLFAYRTYDYIEHDNDFCISCHLMAEPFEAFAQSAHRDLGCKACHKPSFTGRTEMALAQVLENPDEITVHAEVPNEKCASCHIDGDPEKWALVANSAGHRAHLESDDPDLQGLLCVQCHSSGVHEFAATDQTCAQAGCHEEVEIKLGRMGDFTIHCAACHGFNAVLPEAALVDDARSALAPTADECLSCHVMRTLVEIPEDEPHEQVCSSCHNPHEQELPAEAEETCATVGCHNDMRELTPFHRGLEHTAVENCLDCHTAHDFRLDGNDCLSCHRDIYDDEAVFRRVPRTLGAAAPASTPASGPNALGFAGLGMPPAVFRHAPVMASAGAAPLAAPQAPGAQQEVPQERPRTLVSSGEVLFLHGQHRDVECVDCHSSETSHGEITLESISDCRSCHHTEPVAQDCATCHTSNVLGPEPLVAENWRMEFTAGDGAVRSVDFLHDDHVDAECTTCHVDGLQRPFDPASCNTCHEEHHESPADVWCMSCHEEPAEDAHDVDSHLTCAGAGCHEDAPLQEPPRVRNGCLACHQDQVDHEPEDECVQCHVPFTRQRGGA